MQDRGGQARFKQPGVNIGGNRWLAWDSAMVHRLKNRTVSNPFAPQPSHWPGVPNTGPNQDAKVSK